MSGLPALPRGPAPSLREWLREATALLRTAGCESPEALCEFWAAHHLRDTRTGIRLRADELLSPGAREGLHAGLARLLAHEPLQYVCGSTSFYGREFRCDARALIPRPETEELVERVLRSLPPTRDLDPAAAGRPLRILDVGTGTGCIAITLALECPRAELMAVDLSPEALGVARENAQSLGARVNFQLGDALAFPSAAEWSGRCDVVVSNPPYIADGEWQGLAPHVRDHEPRMALAAGPGGMEFYQRLLPELRTFLTSGGIFWLEVGDRQGPALAALAGRLGFRSVQSGQDLSGRNRFLSGRNP